MSLARKAAPASPRRATNITLPESLLQAARDSGINISQACERSLAAPVAEARAKRWLDENRAAFESSKAFIEQHGLPLARFRQF